MNTRRIPLNSHSTFFYNQRRIIRNLSSSSSSFSTYYDSQSGLHVPLHNPNEISFILNKSSSSSTTASSSSSYFVPHQLYKEDPSSDMPDKLKELRDLGITGVILPPIQFPRDKRNLKTLAAIAPDQDFKFFSSGTISSSSGSVVQPPSVSMMVDFPISSDNHNNNNDDNDLLRQVEFKMNRYVQDGTSTTISLILNNNNNNSSSNNNDNETISPIALANKIATLLDKTGGGDYIWLSSSSSSSIDDKPVLDSDRIVQICEELVYLDVTGKTVKSRLLVDADDDEDVIEETMFAGVNKFVITNEEQITIVEEIAKDQGKSILR